MFNLSNYDQIVHTLYIYIGRISSNYLEQIKINTNFAAVFHCLTFNIYSYGNR